MTNLSIIYICLFIGFYSLAKEEAKNAQECQETPGSHNGTCAQAAQDAEASNRTSTTQNHQAADHNQIQTKGGQKPGFGDWIVADKSVLREISARYICFCTVSLLVIQTKPFGKSRH